MEILNFVKKNTKKLIKFLTKPIHIWLLQKGNLMNYLMLTPITNPARLIIQKMTICHVVEGENGAGSSVTYFENQTESYITLAVRESIETIFSQLNMA